VGKSKGLVVFVFIFFVYLIFFFFFYFCFFFFFNKNGLAPRIRGRARQRWCNSPSCRWARGGNPPMITFPERSGQDFLHPSLLRSSGRPSMGKDFVRRRTLADRAN